MIKNMPAYADHYEFVVAREVDGDYWFFGAYSTREKALQVAWDEDGEIFHNEGIQGYEP